MTTSAVAVIPTRFGSERFPGKPLALIAGVPMVVRALRNLYDARSIERVIVATDDERIASVVRDAGGDAVMTPSDLPSGTDRVWLAASGINAEIVVNFQGDEPLLPGSVVDDLVNALRADRVWDLATPVILTGRLKASRGDIVTVARDESGQAQYFSRAIIPSGADLVWRHIGVYAYRSGALERFVAAPPALLERTERLEQLRALALGMRIAAVEVDVVSHGVDRPEDVAVVERLLAATERRRTPAPPRLVVLDVDGVLTDGGITYVGDATQAMTFDVKDGQGVVSLIRAGFAIALLSARTSPALERRAAELGIVHLRLAIDDKATALVRLCEDVGVGLDEVCYVGDDEGDLAPMRLVGVSVAPADAAPAVCAQADVILAHNGGQGAVRELADLLLAR